MLVVETIARIRRDHLVRGVPIKKMARDLRVSKNTVRKVVRGDETSYSYERKIQPMPKLGPWVDELERQLEANEKKARRDRLSLLRIHEDLAALGYGGGYDAVRRYARTWRRRWRLLSPSQGFVPLSFDPGEAYQFDWSHEYARLSGVTTRVSAGAIATIRLLMLTGCSRNEILTLRWEHVDLDKAEMRIVDGKTGARTVHLSPSAVRVLEALPPKPGSLWVIPGAKPGTHMTDIDGSWEAIRVRAGLHDVLNCARR